MRPRLPVSGRRGGSAGQKLGSLADEVVGGGPLIPGVPLRSWRLCKSSEEPTEECFQRTPLRYAGDQ
eukprot:gene5255-14147_t